jgi:predicted ATPase/DNA-binding winged helix-turn-helix (wHTH) protein
LDTDELIEFGRFKLLPHRRELLADGRLLALKDRAFDVLMVLIEAQGAVVSKDALLESVWTGRVVEENSLHVQIAALRKSLGHDQDLIRTVARRGYQFTGTIRRTRIAAGLRLPSTNVPARTSELIGREAQIAELLELFAAHRMITLTGAGGVGKTRLALEVARQLQPRYADGVWISHLAPLADPEFVPAAVASALGISIAGGSSTIGAISAAIGPLRTLLVLDNCEHVIEVATRMSEALLAAGSAVQILATSREPLRADGEYVYRVPSLAVPPEGADLAADPLQWSAVKLFIARARQSNPDFSVDRSSAQDAFSICRRLDGIPLAIELAAMRVDSLGLGVLADRLNDRFDLLGGGKRTALAHQQTLRATLDWSYELLPDAERTIMRRLAIFGGVFSLQAASSVAGSDNFSMSEVIDAMSNLVAKSLVATNSRGPHSGFHLLDTMRAYALEKLGANGEANSVARRHAEYYEGLLNRAAVEWETLHSGEWLETYRLCIDNLRAALDWAFSQSGDAELGVRLTVSAVPLWIQLSFIDECKSYVGKALGAIEIGVVVGERLMMKLHAAHGWYGWSELSSFDPAHGTAAGWTAALEIAERLGDTDYQLRAYWGIWVRHVQNAEFLNGLKIAKRFWEVAKKSQDGADAPVGERLVGMAMHFLGDQRGARRHIEQMLQTYVSPTRRSHIARFQFDQQVMARLTLARVLWLQGFADQASRVIESNIEHALSLSHQLSVEAVLLQSACPISLLCGDLVNADRYIEMLLSYTRRRNQAAWNRLGSCFGGILSIKRGHVAEGAVQLREGIGELRAVGFLQHLPAFLSELAEAELLLGRANEALRLIEGALERAAQTEERWYLPELLRVKGAIELQRHDGSREAAESLFIKSSDCAQNQGALSWELRAAISMARLRHLEGRLPDARSALEPVLARFTEGFETTDLRAARALAGSLATRN